LVPPDRALDPRAARQPGIRPAAQRAAARSAAGDGVHASHGTATDRPAAVGLLTRARRTARPWNLPRARSLRCGHGHAAAWILPSGYGWATMGEASEAAPGSAGRTESTSRQRCMRWPLPRPERGPQAWRETP